MRIYLSSSFSAFEDGAGTLMPMREQLHACGARLGVDVELAERNPEIQIAARAADHMRILEGCARLAGASDAFFGIVFERHGTRVELARDRAVVRAETSFFEAELLEATMTDKPVVVLSIRTAPPGPAMRGFLGLIEGVLGDRLVVTDESGVVPAFQDFARAVTKRTHRPSPWLLDPVSGGRIFRAIRRENGDPRLAFLSGLFRETRDDSPDLAVINAALQRVEDGVDDVGRPLGQIARLSYLWLAMREFAKAPQEFRSPPLSESLQRALERWNSSAAWYGLHGAHPMGCLATLNELAFARLSAKTDAPPHGARASAYYSIGARMRTASIARRFFRQSAALSTLSIRQGQGSGYSLRASASARLAALGAPLLYFDALADYRREVALRTRRGAGASELGEALTEYAYALGRQLWRRKEALRLMREGIDLMRGDDVPTRTGFLIRAQRKYAELLMMDGQWEAAEAEARAACDRAVVAEAYDQARQIKDLLDRIKSRRLKQ